MKKIKLTQNHYALVDNNDFEWLNQWKWCISTSRSGTRYAVRGTGHGRKNRKLTQMHTEILGKHPDGLEIDHKDMNGLNNQRKNLRFATRSENKRNCKMAWNNTSGHKGVSWNKYHNKWKAYAKLNSKQIHIGYFDDIKKATKAYKIFVENNYDGFHRIK
jgi:hypothetical protein